MEKKQIKCFVGYGLLILLFWSTSFALFMLARLMVYKRPDPDSVTWAQVLPSYYYGFTMLLVPFALRFGKSLRALIGMMGISLAIYMLVLLVPALPELPYNENMIVAAPTLVLSLNLICLIIFLVKITKSFFPKFSKENLK